MAPTACGRPSPSVTSRSAFNVLALESSAHKACRTAPGRQPVDVLRKNVRAKADQELPSSNVPCPSAVDTAAPAAVTASDVGRHEAPILNELSSALLFDSLGLVCSRAQLAIAPKRLKQRRCAMKAKRADPEPWGHPPAQVPCDPMQEQGTECLSDPECSDEQDSFARHHREALRQISYFDHLLSMEGGMGAAEVADWGISGFSTKGGDGPASMWSGWSTASTAASTPVAMSLEGGQDPVHMHELYVDYNAGLFSLPAVGNPHLAECGWLGFGLPTVPCAEGE